MNRIGSKLSSILLVVLLIASLTISAFAVTTATDTANLSAAQQAAIQAATNAYNSATTDAGRDAAHAAAEAVRNSAGYTSNGNGDYTGGYSGGSFNNESTNSTASGSTDYNNEAANTEKNGTYNTTHHTDTDEQKMAGLSAADTNTIAALTQMYNNALQMGDPAAAAAYKDAAHTVAEGLRSVYGYSAGADGDYYIPAGSTGAGAAASYFTITATAGAGGSISPNYAVAVKSGDGQTFTITPSTGYKISSVFVDGTSVGAVSTYTFSNVTAAHTVSANFASAATLSGGVVTLGDGGAGTISSIAGGYQMKSGYGFTASAKVTSQYVSNITVTASYKFISAGTTTLENAGSTFQFPVNNSSATKARKVYVPVDTKDGTYTITFTIKALDPQATALTGSNVYLTATETVKLKIKGSMYEDDFTGNS